MLAWNYVLLELTSVPAALHGSHVFSAYFCQLLLLPHARLGSIILSLGEILEPLQLFSIALFHAAVCQL